MLNAKSVQSSPGLRYGSCGYSMTGKISAVANPVQRHRTGGQCQVAPLKTGPFRQPSPVGSGVGGADRSCQDQPHLTDTRDDSLSAMTAAGSCQPALSFVSQHFTGLMPDKRLPA